MPSTAFSDYKEETVLGSDPTSGPLSFHQSD